MEDFERHGPIWMVKAEISGVEEGAKWTDIGLKVLWKNDRGWIAGRYIGIKFQQGIVLGIPKHIHRGREEWLETFSRWLMPLTTHLNHSSSKQGSFPTGPCISGFLLLFVAQSNNKLW